MSISPEDLSGTKIYKKRYLIAVYDKDDHLIDVAFTPKGLTKYRDELANTRSKVTKVKSISEEISRGDTRYVLIDCFEKHDDIFAEEDEKFLDFMENECDLKREAIKERDCSYKTYLRRRKLLNNTDKRSNNDKTY